MSVHGGGCANGIPVCACPVRLMDVSNAVKQGWTWTCACRCGTSRARTAAGANAWRYAFPHARPHASCMSDARPLPRSSWHFPTESEPCCWNWFGKCIGPYVDIRISEGAAWQVPARGAERRRRAGRLPRHMGGLRRGRWGSAFPYGRGERGVGGHGRALARGHRVFVPGSLRRRCRWENA